MTFPQQPVPRPLTFMDDAQRPDPPDAGALAGVSGDPTLPPHLGVLQVPGATPPAPVEDASADAGPLPYTLDCSVRDFVLRRLRSAEKDGEREEWLWVRVVVNNVLMWRGLHEHYAGIDGTINALFDEDDEESQMYNWSATQIEGKAKEWENSRPRMQITGRTRDYRLEQVARLSEGIDAYLRDGQIDAHFRQREAKCGMFAKLYYRYSEVVEDEADESATRYTVPVTETRRMTAGASLMCADCNAAWHEPDDFEGTPVGGGGPAPGGGQAEDGPAPGDEQPQYAPCENCGGEATELAPRLNFLRDVETGESEERVVPVLKHESVNPLLVKCDVRRPFAESWYVIYDTLERRFDVEGLFEDADLSTLPAAGGDLLVRQRAALALERTTSGVATPELADVPTAECREDELVRRRRFWMLPRAYAHYRVRSDETFCGVEMKAGDRLGLHFPDGWKTEVLADDTCVAAENESKNKRWACAPFTLDPLTLRGKGVEDLQSIQRTIDDMATLAVSHFDRKGAPKEIADPRLIDPDDADGDTGKMLQLKDTAPEDKGPGDAIHVLETPELGSDFMNYMGQLPNVLREVGGVSNPMVGLEDPHNTTAAGRATAAAQSSSSLIPSLALRAEMVEPQTTFQNLEYAQEHWADEDFALFESEYGREAIEIFREGLDGRPLVVRRDLIVKAVPGSIVPKTREDELSERAEFSVTYVEPAMQGLLPPEFVEHTAELYNVPAEAFAPTRAKRLAQARLARLREWAQKAEGGVNLKPDSYEMLLQQIMSEPELQPRPFENHAVEKAFLVDQWCALYDDPKATPVLLDLLEMLIQAHDEVAQEQQMRQAMPMVAAQAAQADEEHARDEQSKDADAARQIAVEKAKAQSKPKPSKPSRRGGKK